MDSSTDSKLFEKEEVPTFDQLLNNLTDEEVSTLSQYTDKLEFVPGETIFYQNEPGDSVFIIQRGKV
ncbi:MAG: cyclic nucleotide-binding domain-containing protein [bacterium]